MGFFDWYQDEVEDISSLNDLGDFAIDIVSFNWIGEYAWDESGTGDAIDTLQKWAPFILIVIVGVVVLGLLGRSR